MFAYWKCLLIGGVCMWRFDCNYFDFIFLLHLNLNLNFDCGVSEN